MRVEHANQYTADSVSVERNGYNVLYIINIT